MKKALIDKTSHKVVDVVDSEFETHDACYWADCPDDTVVGMTYADGEYTAPVVTVTYLDQRKMAYPSMEEQLDMQYWDSVNGTTVWADTIAAVKEANPKPE